MTHYSHTFFSDCNDKPDCTKIIHQQAQISQFSAQIFHQNYKP